MDSLLNIRDLEVRLNLKEGVVRAVNGVTLSLAPHRTLGLVGESGCGKSITAKAIMRILPPRAEITRGEIRLAGVAKDIAAMAPDGREIRRIRGADIAMVFQEPMTSFSPVHTVGNQIEESIRLHQKASKREMRARTVELLKLVGVPMPERRVHAYPHELSGGLRQRCMIAMALACHPRLLIADEPTTALDVTIQSQILRLMAKLQKELGMAVLMITHDLGVIAQVADEVAVMYDGRVVEQASVHDLFAAPRHPYTHGLMASIPRLGRGNKQRLESIPGTVPDGFTRIAGCSFHPRCPHRIQGLCDVGDPPPVAAIAPGHLVACHLHAARETPP